MNPIYIFAKTDAGEDAVVQRTRLVQRNLRTVLILVDGKSTVEELVEKAGSAEMVTQALDQLERDGFIRRVGTGARKAQAPAPAPVVPPPPAATPAAIPEAAKAVPEKPETPKAIADKPAAERTPLASPPDDGDLPSQFPPITAAPEKPVRTVAPASPFAINAPAHPQVNPFALPAGDRSAPVFSPAPQPLGGGSASPFQVPAGNPFAGTSPFGTAPAPMPTPAARPVAVEESNEKAADEKPEKARPVRHRAPLLTPGRILGGLGGLVIVLVAVVIFFPYERYQPQIEAALTASTGQPVRVGSVSASFIPVPALVLSQVGIGQGTPVTVSEIRAVPSASSLFFGKKSFGRVSIVGARVPMEQLGALASGIGAAGRGEDFSIREVDFSGVTIGLRDLSLDNYRGKAEMGGDGSIKRVELVSPDRSLTLSLVTGAGAAQVSIEGQGWKPGEGSPYIFDSLSISGEMAGTRLQVQKVEGRIFGGVIQGQFLLDWSTGMAVSGDISVDYMSAPLLGAALGTGKITVDGQANARFRFRASGENWSALAGKVPLEGDVIMKEGAINGMDLVEAVRRGGQLAMRGGITRFEKATGKFRWDGKALQLYDIDMSSGIVRATGSLGVLKSEQISGVLNVSLRGSAATVATPVSVSGTLKDPQLFGGRR